MSIQNDLLPPAEAYRLCAMGHANVVFLTHSGLVQRGLDRTEAAWIALQSVMGFAVENALKAFLSATGMTRKELRSRFSHGLEDLADEAKQRWLHEHSLQTGHQNMINELDAFIMLCGSDYGSFNYRYLEREQATVLFAGQATTTLVEIVYAISDIADMIAKDGQTVSAVQTSCASTNTGKGRSKLNLQQVSFFTAIAHPEKGSGFSLTFLDLPGCRVAAANWGAIPAAAAEALNLWFVHQDDIEPSSSEALLGRKDVLDQLKAGGTLMSVPYIKYQNRSD